MSDIEKQKQLLESLHDRGTDRLLEAIERAKPVRKILEEVRIGPSRVWLESDFQLMSNQRLLKRYRVCFEDAHVVRRVEWVGRDSIDAAHRAYVAAIQSCLDHREAAAEARRLEARRLYLVKSWGSKKLPEELMGRLGDHVRRSRIGFHHRYKPKGGKR